MKEKVLRIINNYGAIPQLKYMQTEMFEFVEAIIKYENIPNGIYEHIKNEYKEHIAEEIADITVMLKQFQYYYGITDEEIINNMQFKIKRQLERIKKGK